MEILYVLSAFFILGSTLAESSWPDSCANIEPLATLNTTWLEGLWYAQGAYKPVDQPQPKRRVICGTFNFRIQKDGFEEAIFKFHLKPNTASYGAGIETFYNGTFSVNEPARLIDTAITMGNDLHQQILAIFENEGLVIYQCDVKKGEQFIYMLTKERVPNKDLYKKVNKSLPKVNGNWSYHDMTHESCEKMYENKGETYWP